MHLASIAELPGRRHAPSLLVQQRRADKLNEVTRSGSVTSWSNWLWLTTTPRTRRVKRGGNKEGAACSFAHHKNRMTHLACIALRGSGSLGACRLTTISHEPARERGARNLGLMFHTVEEVCQAGWHRSHLCDPPPCGASMNARDE